jgi:hypothetical protein
MTRYGLVTSVLYVRYLEAKRGMRKLESNNFLMTNSFGTVRNERFIWEKKHYF